MSQYNDFKGQKYDSKLSRKDIAALLRKEYRAKFPTVKISVRLSPGRGIDVEIQSWPNSSGEILNFERYQHDHLNPHAHRASNDSQLPVHSKIAREVLAEVEAIANAYNHDRSDIMTDYFDVNFYLTAKFSHELLQRERQDFEVRLAGFEAQATEVEAAPSELQRDSFLLAIELLASSANEPHLGGPRAVALHLLQQSTELAMRAGVLRGAEQTSQASKFEEYSAACAQASARILTELSGDFQRPFSVVEAEKKVKQ